MSTAHEDVADTHAGQAAAAAAVPTPAASAEGGDGAQPWAASVDSSRVADSGSLRQRGRRLRAAAVRHVASARSGLQVWLVETCASCAAGCVCSRSGTRMQLLCS